MSLIGRKYRVRRTIGEGNFAKVKLAVNTYTGEMVAIKIIDKMMVFRDELMPQVEREISAMKVLDHPNIVRIHEVAASKTKIFIVMEYVSGGEVLHKLNYHLKLNEEVSRKYFQQLIDAVDYCHERGIYHRDLKPENLLIDCKGNLKVTDFGLSAFHKPDVFLTTACGSPHYVAPEVIAYKGYEGAPVDIWACGVILYEFLAGKRPFEGDNLPSMCRKIKLAKFEFPIWFTERQRNLITKMLNPLSLKRIKIADIFEDEWFKIEYYMPSQGIQIEEHLNLDNDVINQVRDRKGESSRKCTAESKNPNFINAFQIIAMSKFFDLSGFFQGQGDDEKKIKLESEHSFIETLEKVKEAAKKASLFVERTKDSKLRLRGTKKLAGSRSNIMLSAEVIQLTPNHCLVEIYKYEWGLIEYNEFCKGLSVALKESPSNSPDLQF